MGGSGIFGSRHDRRWPGVPARTRRGGRRHAQATVRRAFTLAELMVAVAVLLVLMTMVGWIFATATHATSVATASNELMGSARAIQAQIDRDFQGLLKDRFIGIWYQLSPDPTDPTWDGGSTPTKWLRTDRIVFSTAGDQSTIQQMDTLGAPVCAQRGADVLRP